MAEFANFLKSWVRTMVPGLVAWLIGVGVIPASLSDEAVLGFTALIFAAYYTVARLLEKYVSPWFGVLLGLPAQPSYQPVKEVLYVQKP
jgi:hypothetical protein